MIEKQRLSILQCAQRGLCINHQDRKGTPNPSDTIPYCKICKQKQAKRNRGIK